jgi:hypothetical protein
MGVQMFRPTKSCQFFCVLLISLAFTSNATVFAGVIAALGLEAHAGVDEATRAWLSTLPQQWRDQINKIVEDTLTSVDAHLDKDLIKIREQLALAEDEAACKWIGANRQTIDVWKSELPFLKQPEPLRDLSDYIQKQRRNALEHRLDPVYMQLLYDDLQNKVAVIRCEPNLSAGSKVNLDSTAYDLTTRWIVWRRMDTIKCGNQETCFANYRSIVQKSLEDAGKIDGLGVPQDAIKKANGEIASIEIPSMECGFFRGLFGKDCYDIEDYEKKLLALGNVDDRVRLIVAAHTIHEKLDAAVLTTEEVDPGTLKPGATLRSPNNAYFAVMQSDCNFAIFKGPYTTSAERLAFKYVVANTATKNPAFSNCRLDLQRDGNFVLYADVTSTTIQFRGMADFREVTNVARNSSVWTSKSSDGGNADYWLVLMDSGKLEIHAGTPFADGGTLFVSKLLAGRTLEFTKLGN